MKEVLLAVEDLHVHFFSERGIVKALNGASLEVHKGEGLGLVGETGCGKSLLARSVMRLMPSRAARIMAGRVMLKDTDLLRLGEREMRLVRGSKIAMVFQEPASCLNPVMRVGDQILESVRLHGKVVSLEEAHSRVMEVLELVGMPEPRDVARRYPHQLSGGMQQRVMIAMAVSCNPLLLIADEPTTALDVTIQAQVLDLIKGLRDTMGLSLLFISHDFGVVAEICDTVAVMYAGTVVELAATADLLEKQLHPYSQGLFDAMPQTRIHRERLGVIPGTVPDPTDLPCGCLFAPRCHRAFDRCREERPQRHHVGSRRWVACHLYDSG